MPRAAGFNGGTVRLRVLEGKDLAAMDRGGLFSKATSDPYVPHASVGPGKS